jgi:polyferredoxin
MKTRREHQPIRKKHRRWLLYLIAAGIVFFSIWALAARLTFAAFPESPIPQRIVATLIPTLIAVAFLLVVLLGSRIFPWRYSVIGPYERSPPPKDFSPQV